MPYAGRVGGVSVALTLALARLKLKTKLFRMADTSMFMVAAAAGELGIIGWLLIKGARDEPVEIS